MLDDVALVLRSNSQATVAITGHSDSEGTRERQAERARERAQNARDYLVRTHNISASRIDIDSAGADQPVGDNATEAGRARNRRIEIEVSIP